MTKLKTFLIPALTLFFFLLSFTAAKASGNQPLSITSALVETESNRVVGEIKVCNKEEKGLRFSLDVKNLTINSIYKRNFFIKAETCQDFKVRFTKNFADMSNAGDEIEFVARRVNNIRSAAQYEPSEAYKTVVVKGEKDDDDCSDEMTGDGTLALCAGEFIYHLPSGLRMKVEAVNTEFITLKLTHIEWGGVKTLVLYKGRSKAIRSNYDELTRVTLINPQDETTISNQSVLTIESEM